MKKEELIKLLEEIPGDEVEFFTSIHNGKYVKARPVRITVVTNDSYKYVVHKEYYKYANQPEHVIEGITLESNINQGY